VIIVVVIVVVVAVVDCFGSRLELFLMLFFQPDHSLTLPVVLGKLQRRCPDRIVVALLPGIVSS